ncbi:MAG: phosphoribulokinase [Rhodospirillales bacterium]|nr:phosphoribulokinase [Rhodospirillales bacterium]
MGGKPRQHPVIIGIVGDSAAGKTTMAAGLAEVLGPRRTLNICIDDYHRYDRAERARRGITPHDPAANYMDVLEQHVYLLREGQPILKPVYNHNGGVLEAPEYVEPRDFIILEGLLGYATPLLRDAYDVKFYLEPDEQLRHRWKFQRDLTQGAYSREQIMAALPMLQRDSARFVIPQRGYADMVVSFYPPQDRPEETGAHLSVAHILRPTLPHLDLAPVLEQGADKGFMLELTRDVDGRPVDALHVSGAIDAAAAEAMEEVLWGLLPDRTQERGRPGAFFDGREQSRFSRPLALSQLLIGHYLLNAAIAHHDT